MDNVKFVFLIIILLSAHQSHAQKKVYTLEDYIDKHKLDFVTTVESSKDTLTVYGYMNDDDQTLLKKRIKLERKEVLAISEWSNIGNKWHYLPWPISITTVPIKVRPRVDEFATTASAGITNVGLNFDLLRWQTERYFANEKKSKHKFYAGIWVAPSVEELDSITTRGFISPGSKTKQLFISTALTINYTYNNLTFTFVPLGFDIATSTEGKNWIYNERRWWGFGIGLEPKFLNPTSNK